jgi:hypothetical protein
MCVHLCGPIQLNCKLQLTMTLYDTNIRCKLKIDTKNNIYKLAPQRKQQAAKAALAR